jgi:putative DNA methylase
VSAARKQVLVHARQAGLDNDPRPLGKGGRGAQAYADAVATYLALAVDKAAAHGSSICSWLSGRDAVRHTFARPAIPMVWNFVEANPFSNSTGNFQGAIDWVAEVIQQLPAHPPSSASLLDATTAIPAVAPLLATDPPYYDNIGFADLADFFYIWLRRALRAIYPISSTPSSCPRARSW